MRKLFLSAFAFGIAVSVQAQSPDATAPSSDLYYSASRSGGMGYDIRVPGLGTEKASLEFWMDMYKKPQQQFAMERVNESVYVETAMLDKSRSYFLVTQPDGRITIVGASDSARTVSTVATLTKNKAEKKTLDAATDKAYADNAAAKARAAYVLVYERRAKNNFKTLSAAVKLLKGENTEPNLMKAERDISTKLFASPSCAIPNLQLLRVISVSPDWNTIRFTYNNALNYRVRTFIVLAKSKTNGKCYAMYTDMVEEYIGKWGADRAATSKERTGDIYKLNNKDVLRWGQLTEIECP